MIREFACRKSSLNGFDILSICLQQCAEGVPESVPSDFLVNANRLRNWLNVPLHEGVRPIGLFPLHGLASEDVVIV
jgi:hypothetical protein